MRERLRSIRAWLLKRLSGVAVEDVPEIVDVSALDTAALWGDLWALRSHKTFWPGITRSDVWKEGLEPFFRESLLRTAAQMMTERDEDTYRTLQVRMQLLNEWLEAPIRAEMMVQIALNNAYQGGNPEDLDRTMERVSGRPGRQAQQDRKDATNGR